MNESSLFEESIFLQALEIPAGKERDEFLDRACGADASLRAGVEALLQASLRSGDLLDVTEAGQPPSSPGAAERVPREQPGAQIGPYKLLQEIGRGGMGVVFMAEQTQPVQRRVALKIIKPGMDSRQVIARFEAERQALAMMDHPNIARVLDAGTTESGRPYFVMELVVGAPITRYCDEQHLTTRERLELLVPVCQAVQHAHQKGIIHRDLKPSNILMAVVDGRPMPKVIDFGVAKATRQRLTEKTMFTEFGQIVGTLEYMSPEQARLDHLDIDTRSDIYSLGVLMYELLTGATPIDRGRLRNAAFDELLRIIREEEPPKPSNRLSTVESLPNVAANRRIEPRKLGSLLRGDLDWIVMKALDKDRARRYDTANGLAADLRRYLSDETVSACPPSAGYRFRKFARKHRVALATTSLVAFALVAGIIGTSWQAIRATRAEREARDNFFAADDARRNEAEQRKQADTRRREAVAARDEADARRGEAEASRQAAEAVAAFLVQAYRSPDPERSGLTITVAEVLSNALDDLISNDNLAPEARAKLLEAVGESLSSLGLHDRGIQALEAAVSVNRGRGEPGDPRLHGAELALAGALCRARRFDEAIEQLNRRLDALRASSARDAPRIAETLYRLGTTEQAAMRHESAVALLEEALAILDREQTNAKGDSRDEGLADMVARALGEALRAAGRTPEAVSMLERLLARQREAKGPGHPEPLAILQELASAYAAMMQHERALELRREIYERRRAGLGQEHNLTTQALFDLGASHVNIGKFAKRSEHVDRGLPMMEQALQLRESRHGLDHASLIPFLSRLTDAYIIAGRMDIAHVFRRREAAIAEASYGAGHPATLGAMELLASVTPDKSEAAALRAAVKERRTASASDANSATARRDSKNTEHGYRSTVESRRLAEIALETRRVADGPTAPSTLKAMAILADACRSTADFSRAIELYRQVLDARATAAAAPDDAETISLRLALAESLEHAGQVGEAVEVLERLLRSLDGVDAADEGHSIDARNRLAAALEASGQYDLALVHLLEAFDVCLRRYGIEHRETNQARWRLVRASQRATAFFAEPTPADAPARTRLAERIAQSAPTSGVALHNFGMALFHAREWAGCSRAFEKARATRDGARNVLAYFCGAIANGRENNLAEARELYLEGLCWQAERLRDVVGDQYRQEAERLIGIDAARRHELAIEYLGEKLSQSPSDAARFRQRAGVYRILGDLNREAADLEQATRHAPYYLDGWRDLVAVRYLLGERDQARATVHRARELVLGDPALTTNAERHDRLSAIECKVIDALWRASLEDRAGAQPAPDVAAFIEDVFEMFTVLKDAEVIYQHGAWLVRAGRQEDSERFFHRFAEAAANTPNPRLQYLLARTGALSPVCDESELCHRLARSSVAKLWTGWSVDNLAFAQLRSRRYDEAIGTFHQALDLRGSEGAHQQRALEWLGLAILHRERGRDEEARKWLAKAEAFVAAEPRQLTNDSDWHPHDRIALEILLEEARRKTATATASSPAR